MRSYHVLLRGSVLVMLASLTIACNSVLGIEDVELVPPDCKVDAHFPLVSSASAPGVSLIHLTSGAPSLLLLLNADPQPDGLFLRLYDYMGGHNAVNTPGRFQLTAADAKLETCGICVSINVDFDLSNSTFAGTYFARGAGDLQLTTADSTRLTGTMHNLTFRHVDTTGGTKDINDGCTVTVDTVEFDVPYSASVGPLRAMAAASAPGPRR